MLTLLVKCRAFTGAVPFYSQRYKATAPPNAASRCAAPQNSANVAPQRAARRVKILFFWMLIMHGRFFLQHVTVLAIVIGHRATPKKRGAVKDKLFPAFISRRGSERRSLQCSPYYDKQYSPCFFTARRSAASGGAVPVLWCTFKFLVRSPSVFCSYPSHTQPTLWVTKKRAVLRCASINFVMIWEEPASLRRLYSVL